MSEDDRSSLLVDDAEGDGDRCDVEDSDADEDDAAVEAERRLAPSPLSLEFPPTALLTSPRHIVVRADGLCGRPEIWDKILSMVD